MANQSKNSHNITLFGAQNAGKCISNLLDFKWICGSKDKCPINEIQIKTPDVKEWVVRGGGVWILLGRHKNWAAIYLLQKLLKQKKDRWNEIKMFAGF